MANNPAPNPRKPSDKLQVAALTGAVLMATPDGHNIVITPKVAIELAKQLDGMAQLAGGMSMIRPNLKYPTN